MFFLPEKANQRTGGRRGRCLLDAGAAGPALIAEGVPSYLLVVVRALLYMIVFQNNDNNSNGGR